MDVIRQRERTCFGNSNPHYNPCDKREKKIIRDKVIERLQKKNEVGMGIPSMVLMAIIQGIVSWAVKRWLDRRYN